MQSNSLKLSPRKLTGQVKVTGQRKLPQHDHIFSTLYNGKRFDVSIKLNTVHFSGFNSMGSFSRKMTGDNIINHFVSAVKEHVKINNITVDSLKATL